MSRPVPFDAESKAALFERLGQLERTQLVRVVPSDAAGDAAPAIDLFMQDGAITMVRTAVWSGTDALLWAAIAREGHVEVDPVPNAAPGDPVPFEEAFAEAEVAALAYLDLVAPLGGIAAVLATRADRLAEVSAQIPDAANAILKLIDGEHTVASVTRAAGHPCALTARILRRLFDLGVVERHDPLLPAPSQPAAPASELPPTPTAVGDDWGDGTPSALASDDAFSNAFAAPGRQPIEQTRELLSDASEAPTPPPVAAAPLPPVGGAGARGSAEADAPSPGAPSASQSSGARTPGVGSSSAARGAASPGAQSPGASSASARGAASSGAPSPGASSSGASSEGASSAARDVAASAVRSPGAPSSSAARSAASLGAPSPGASSDAAASSAFSDAPSSGAASPGSAPPMRSDSAARVRAQVPISTRRPGPADDDDAVLREAGVSGGSGSTGWIVALVAVLVIGAVLWSMRGEDPPPPPPPPPPPLIVSTTTTATVATATVTPDASDANRATIAAPDAPEDVKRAERLLDAGRYREAGRLLDQLRGSRPDDAAVFVLSGQVYVDTGRLGEARAMADRALAIDPRSYRAWVLKGSADQFSGRYGSAMRAYERARELGPSHPMAPEIDSVIEQLRRRVR